MKKISLLSRFFFSQLFSARHDFSVCWIFFFLATLGIFIFPFCGATSSNAEIQAAIYSLRFNRVLLASLTGGGLALAGLVFQTLFRNALATPYTLGVASGSALGATIVLCSGFLCGGLGIASSAWLGFSAVSWGALVGALLATFLVYGLASARRTSNEQMLLAGVAVNLFFASLVLILQYISDPSSALRIIRWTVGGIDAPRLQEIARLAPIIFAYAATLWFFARELDLLLTGDDHARSLGVSVSLLRTTLFFATSLIVGLMVALCGPIGFVGLMVPHLTRILTGPRHRVLVPATFFLGGFFLATCDTFARCAISVCELPVGAITSILGGPFFLWLLLAKNKRLD